MSQTPPTDHKNAEPRPPTLWQTTLSVMAAFFGVQSERNRQRDFTSGKPTAFILIGIVSTVLLIGGLWALVQLMLRNTGQ